MSATVAPLVTADGPQDRAVGTRTGELFAAHARMVFAICRSSLRDSDEAEDATQAAFLSAHEALVRGAVVRDPGAWIATIARNECRARLRGRRIEPLELRVEELAASVTTDDDAERRATVAHLQAAIASLPEKQRDAVVLRDLYGLRYGEICDALDVSRPSVEALLFRARRTLRIRLRPVGGAAIVVPVAVREGLAQAVPWFAQGQAAGASAAAGAGILTHLGGSVVAKVAVGAVAVGVAGSTVGADGPRVPPQPAGGRAVAQAPPLVADNAVRPEIPVARTRVTPPGTIVATTTSVRRVVPTVASRPGTAGVSAVRPSAPTEEPVTRPVTRHAEPTRRVPRLRVAPDARPAGRTDTNPARTTTTRTEPEPAPSTRNSRPPATVARGTGDATQTTEARTDPGTATVPADMRSTPTR